MASKNSKYTASKNGKANLAAMILLAAMLIGAIIFIVFCRNDTL